MSTNHPKQTNSPQSVDLQRADLSESEHQRFFLELLDAYMRHPMGAQQPMPPEHRDKLIQDLTEHPFLHVLFAMDQDKAIGIAVCFLGYSTFYAERLLNIHDLFVESAYRGKGVGLLLLQGVESWARELNCCKVTLEVHADNHRGRKVYEEFGFDGGRNKMSFWTKPLVERR